MVEPTNLLPTLNLPTTPSSAAGMVDAVTRAEEQGGAGAPNDQAGADPVKDAAFKASLSMAKHTLGADVSSPEDAVRKAANELVANAFFVPMFKMMRDDPLRSDFIPVSTGEKLFGPLLDAEISRRMTEREHFPIADALVRRLLPHQQAKEKHPIEWVKPIGESGADRPNPLRDRGFEFYA